jgi:hypothetical protein
MAGGQMASVDRKPVAQSRRRLGRLLVSRHLPLNSVPGRLASSLRRHRRAPRPQVPCRPGSAVIVVAQGRWARSHRCSGSPAHHKLRIAVAVAVFLSIGVAAGSRGASCPKLAFAFTLHAGLKSQAKLTTFPLCMSCSSRERDGWQRSQSAPRWCWIAREAT